MMTWNPRWVTICLGLLVYWNVSNAMGTQMEGVMSLVARMGLASLVGGTVMYLLEKRAW
jgi:hypothetical protein